MEDKFERQDAQYEFPYHYLAYMDEDVPEVKRSMFWGYEYLTYMGVVIEEANKIDAGKILDVGCGDGYLLNHLKPSASKLGIDLSEKAIMFAKSFSNEAEFEVKDLFSINNQYDLVSLVEVLEHIPCDSVDRFVEKLLSLVKEGGYFIISVPTTVLPLSKKHYRHYDEKLLDSHIDKFGCMELVKDMRVYKASTTLTLIRRMLNNRLWSVNMKYILKAFWKWHKKSNIYANKNDGHHIIRIYKKSS